MPLKILFTHSELDSIMQQVVLRLAHDTEHFRVFVTTSPSDIDRKGEGVTVLPTPEILTKCSIGVIRALRRYNREHHFDVIFSMGSSALSNALLATLGSDCINIGYRGTGAKIRRLDPTYYLGVLNPRLKHLVCETIHVQQYLKEFIDPCRLSVFTKPFDTAMVAEASKSPLFAPGIDPNAEHTKLIMVADTDGRPYKGLRVLLDALIALGRSDIDFTLVGDYEEGDLQHARKSAIAHKIHFVGRSKQALQYIAGADILVLPSYRDASPRVLREAMAIGRPTIVSDIKGARDLVVPNRTSLLFEAGNPDALAQCILQLHNAPMLRQEMGAAGREHLIQEFSVDTYVERFKEMLHEVVKRERGI